jgi:hypothetical protein
MSVMKLNGQSHFRPIVSISCTVCGQNVKMHVAVLVVSKTSAYEALNMRPHSKAPARNLHFERSSIVSKFAC